MNKSVNTTAYLTGSAIKMFLRNRQALFFTLFMPIVIMTIFGMIGFDRIPKIHIGVAAGNPQPATVQFIDALKSVPAFEVTVGTEPDERAALIEGERVLVLVLPDDLIPAPGTTTTTARTIPILKNVGQEQQAATALPIINQFLDKTTIALAGAPVLFSPTVEDVSSRNVRYIDFLLPGIVAMAIMQMAVFSVSFVFVDYKEKGILKRLLATPMKPYQFVTSNAVTRLLVAILQTAILILLGIILFKTHVYGSYWLVALTSVLGGAMFLGLGFTISGIAKTVDAVPAVANLIIFPMLFLSGVFFPTDTMAPWLQRVVEYLPLTHFADALRMVMAEGKGWTAIATDVWWLAGWAVVLFVLAVVTFRFEEKRV